jgi:DNA repair protein RadC
MPRFKKGSAAAKAYMAQIRKAKGKPGRKAKLKVYAKENNKGKVSIYARTTKKKKNVVGSFGYSTYKKAPADVKKIIDALDFMEDYGKLEKAKKALAKKGYFMDYGLDGSITELKKITKAKKPSVKKVGATKLSEAKAKAKKPATKKISGYQIPKERIFITGSIMTRKKLCGIGKTNNTIDYNVPPIKVLIQKREISKLPKITSSMVAAQICRESINKTGLMQTQEVFGVLILNNQNQVLGVYNHTIGAQNSTQIDVTLIAAMISKLAPKAAIIFHNHPSGALNPSDADLLMTKQLKEATKILGCQLIDSLIITDRGYYSLADEGKF